MASEPPNGTTPGRQAGWSGWGRLAAATALATWALVVLGGVVRITGSGMGCGPDWPLCHGQLVPTMDFPTFVEWAHRLVAAGVGLLVFSVAAYGWRGRGETGRRGYRRLGFWAAALLLLQVLLGAVTVWLELPPASVILHLGTAMALLGVLVHGATRALAPRPAPAVDDAGAVTWATAGVSLVVVLAGALVANLEAAPACQGFPLCNGQLWPEGGWRIQLHWGHRLVAYGLIGWLLYLPRWVGKRRPDDVGLRRWAGGSAALAALQLAAGAALVLTGVPAELQALHLALGSALFGVLVILATLATRAPGGSGSPSPAGAVADAGRGPAAAA